MRKSIVILNAVLSVCVLVAYAVILQSNEAQQPDVSKSFVGKTYDMQFYPYDESNRQNRSIAEFMNQYGFTVQFVDDSTYIRRSKNEIGTEAWSIKGDSITLGGDKFLLTSTNETFVLIDPELKVELTPLR